MTVENCPFCDAIQPEPPYIETEYGASVSCHNCSALGPSVEADEGDTPEQTHPKAIERWNHRAEGGVVGGAVGRDIANAREVGEAMQNFLSSHVAMALFSKLTLYRASGENPRVVVKYTKTSTGHGGLPVVKFRVSLHRSNGEVEHYNRDGKE